MNEEDKDIVELAMIAGRVSKESRNLIIATDRAALFGEQSVRKEYDQSLGTGNPRRKRVAR